MKVQLTLGSFSESGAEFGGAANEYRYRLWRGWKLGTRRVLWLMLNPSTADENANDPTIRRCIAFSKAWGFDGLEVANLFAFRSTDPKALAKVPDPIGPGNNHAIRAAAYRCSLVVCAWGNGGAFLGRGRAVAEILRHQDLRCFRITGGDQPEHPLYQPGEKFPTPAHLLTYGFARD